MAEVRIEEKTWVQLTLVFVSVVASSLSLPMDVPYSGPRYKVSDLSSLVVSFVQEARRYTFAVLPLGVEVYLAQAAFSSLGMVERCLLVGAQLVVALSQALEAVAFLALAAFAVVALVAYVYQVVQRSPSQSSLCWATSSSTFVRRYI